jgi:A/G-specific adenine glycosylase
MTFAQGQLAALVVHWQALHGRHTLPWQQTRDPYRVWLSEIMLQQTQVVTVLSYYQRFLERFPDVQSLANASQDEVMGLWSGLGYYSRARNLHHCAQKIAFEFDGVFPCSAQVLQTLPGIGRSTAGAIAAFCFSERVPILDANVRRVLTRVLGFQDDLAVPANERKLWQHAHDLLPTENISEAMPRYTQGLMDLGAGICVPRNPGCMHCPLQQLCVAHAQGEPERYPVRTRKLKRRAESWWLLVLRSTSGSVWLERRPSRGIWAQLHSPPIFPDAQSAQKQVENSSGTTTVLEPFLHVLTHRDLYLHPVLVDVSAQAMLSDQGDWYEANQWNAVGLPAPVRKLLYALPAKVALVAQ